MMELVDMRDLGSRAAMRWGSSPHARTITLWNHGYNGSIGIFAFSDRKANSHVV